MGAMNVSPADHHTIYSEDADDTTDTILHISPHIASQYRQWAWRRQIKQIPLSRGSEKACFTKTI